MLVNADTLEAIRTNAQAIFVQGLGRGTSVPR